tara:strand:- start:5279 stop:7384 length:2106 start_codon:yes stop_codon:yes gene_type:complete
MSADVVTIKYVVDTTEIDTKIPKVTNALTDLNDAASKADPPLAKLSAAQKQAAKDAAALEAQTRKLEVGFAGNSKQIDRLTASEGKASKAAKDFDAMLDRLNGTTKKASVFQDGAAKATAKASNAFGETGSKAAKLAGGMDLLSQGSGEAARGLADVADIGEVGVEALTALGVSGAVATAALGAMLAALLPIGGALVVMARESAEADARVQFLATHAHDLDNANRGLEASLLAASLATSGMSAEQQKLIDIQVQAEQSVEDFAKAQEKERIAASDEIKAADKRLGQLSVLPDVLATAIDYYGGYTSAINEAYVKIDTLNTIEGKHNEIVVKTRDAQTEAANAESKRTKGLKAQSDWLAKINAQMTEENALAMANATQFATASNAFQQSEEKALDAIKKRRDGEIGAIDSARNKEVAGLKAQYEAEYNALANNLSAQETLQADYRAAVAAIDLNADQQREAIMVANEEKRAEQRAADLADAKKITDEQAAYEKKAAEETLAARRELSTSSLDLANSYVTGVIGGAADLAESLGASEKKVFAIRKTAAMASATILAAQAILVALATPPPLTGPAIALAVIAGGLQVATIAASKPPSMRTGGMVGGDIGAYAGVSSPSMPDAMPVSAERGEAILTRQGVATFGGEQGVRDGNAGIGPAPIEIPLVLGHQTMQRVIADQMRRPSSSRYATLGPMPSSTNIYTAVP